MHLPDLSLHPGLLVSPFLRLYTAGQAQHTQHSRALSLSPSSLSIRTFFFFFWFDKSLPGFTSEADLWWTKRQEMIHPYSPSPKVSMQVPAEVQVETEQFASGPTTLASWAVTLYLWVGLHAST